MADPTPIDHREAASLLTARLRDRPRLVGLLQAWLSALNPLDETLCELPEGVASVDAAEGAQLEVLVRVVGAVRRLGDEEIQRALVKTEILARRSSGTIPDLLQILDALYPGSDVPLEEIFPAGILAGPVLGTTEEYASTVRTILERARAAGVGLGLTWSPEINAFGFADGDVPEVDFGEGFGNADNAAQGGYLVGIL